MIGAIDDRGHPTIYKSERSHSALSAIYALHAFRLAFTRSSVLAVGEGYLIPFYMGSLDTELWTRFKKETNVQ